MPISPDQDRAVSDLTARAEALEKRTARPDGGAAHGAAVNQAYRIVVELFGGVLVGLAIGFGIDQVADTSPWGLIGGVLVGFALSVYLARRTANRLMAQAAAEQAAAEAASASQPGSRTSPASRPDEQT
jgi:ATP synthase protein I